MQIEPRILAYGRFLPQDILVSINPSNRKTDPEIESQIENLWHSRLALAQEQEKVCYNGLSYRLNTLTRAGEKIIVDLAEIEYKVRECIVSIPEYWSLNDDYYCKGCHTGATIKTSDDRYLMIELSGKSMNINTVDVLGGVLEIPPRIISGDDIFESLYRELEEEGCIKKEDIAECYVRLVYLSHRTLVGFHFEVTIKPTAEELFKRFVHMHADQDVRSLLHYAKDEYLKVLCAHNPSKQIVAQYTTL